MSINYELLRNMYPEWEPKVHPLVPFLKIFLAIAFFLVIPYLYMKFIECRLGALREKILQRLRALLPAYKGI